MIIFSGGFCPRFKLDSRPACVGVDDAPFVLARCLLSFGAIRLPGLTPTEARKTEQGDESVPQLGQSETD